MLVPAVIVLAPLAAALLAPLLALRRLRAAYAIAVGGCGVSLVAAVLAAARVWEGGALRHAFGGWAAPYGIEYVVDGPAAFMAVVVALVGLAAVVAAGPLARAELGPRSPAAFALAALLVAALQGMVVTGDLFNLYVFLEIASITTYTLVAARGGPAALAGFRYLLLGTLGASLYLIGLACLLALTGTLNMADMRAALPQAGGVPSVAVAAALIVTGFALKMAVLPMHGWLPEAYARGPDSFLPLIAGLVTKVNAFALFRVLYGVLWPVVSPAQPALASLLGWLAAGGILWGSAMALAQSDVKRLLAYSSVSQIGYVVLGLVLGNAVALTGAFLHIAAHALAKSCLFVVAGAAERAGVRDVGDWNGLARRMPGLGSPLVVAAFSMIGIPPTAGFASKWYLILGSLEAGRPELVALLLLSSLLNAWYFFRLLERAWFAGEGGGAAAAPGRPPAAVRLGAGALAAGIVAVGLLALRVAGGPLAGLGAVVGGGGGG